MITAVPFDLLIFEQLHNPEFAAAYVKYALIDGDEKEFLMASRQYAQVLKIPGSQHLLPDTAAEPLKAALEISFEAYATELREIVKSSSIQHTDL